VSFLVILCEGYTEMDFVQQVLVEHLATHGTTCHPMLLGKKIKHDHPEAPGGVFKYEPVYRHISAALRQYSSETSFVTTMVDFYAFPRDFPGYDELVVEPVAAHRVKKFEEAMFNHVGRNKRFIPNIQLHEFEALIFSDLEALRPELTEIEQAESGLNSLIANVAGLKPEEVNQTPAGAPSKRLKAFLPYHKREMGVRIAKQIGWKKLKKSCPHFGEWLTRLEGLGGSA